MAVMKWNASATESNPARLTNPEPDYQGMLPMITAACCDGLVVGALDLVPKIGDTPSRNKKRKTRCSLASL